MNEQQVDLQVRRAVRRIVDQFAPSMVLLFGSRARAEARPDSDVDLIVVWKDENPPPRRAAVVRRALGHVGFPLDLAVVTPAEFARLREWRGGVFHAAAHEGVVLHGA
ncbi:MAG: nucleotidyltransferase domain-containing protein [Thermoanaerobaculia bacterium]